MRLDLRQVFSLDGTSKSKMPSETNITQKEKRLLLRNVSRGNFTRISCSDKPRSTAARRFYQSVSSTALQRGGLTIDVPVVTLLTSLKRNPFRSIRSQGIHSNGMRLSVYAEGNRKSTAQRRLHRYECGHLLITATKNWSADDCSLSTRNFGYTCICSHLTHAGDSPIAIIAGVLLFVPTVVILLVRKNIPCPWMRSNAFHPIKFDEKIPQLGDSDFGGNAVVNQFAATIQGCWDRFCDAFFTSALSHLSWSLLAQGEHHHEMNHIRALNGRDTYADLAEAWSGDLMDDAV
ncbi:hypothetical protein PROFUN_03465 [Planoprotostelium fungivorum]|uniref:GPS domain-containing protein n=1 Tax=Planoprotostelium fungivorum TaxID=1890364 RepID=A0A2P6MN77_9EUKA|nr:hypothetical protein PROFUN_03465 [Planoprotostelium fungivorum]